MTDSPLYWEDFEIGMTVEARSEPLTEASIIEFAQRYDPQYFHVDPVHAKDSIYGGLIASGWHTMAIAMRLMFGAYLERATVSSLGSPGVDNLRWLKPVRPGDSLQMTMTVKARKPSSSKPDRGTVLHLWEVLNQRDELVATMEGYGMFKRRPAGTTPAA